MFDVKVDVTGFDELRKQIKELDEAFDESEILKVIAFDELARIKLRTLRGVDYQERTFQPYSDSWQATRADRGLPTSVVDLFFSGRMYAAMDFELVGKDSVRLFFNSAIESAKAHGHHHGYSPHKLPAREFFSISVSDEKEMVKTLDDEMIRLTELYFK